MTGKSAARMRTAYLATTIGLFALAPAYAAGPDGDPVKGGTLVIGQDSLQPNLEPLPPTITYPQRVSFDLFYEGLLRFDAERNLQPSLAASWEKESDTRYRFRLREGVTFHNGSPFTAADVVYTMNRVLDPKRPSDAGTKMQLVSSVKAEDDHTVVFELKQPFVPFLAYLASPEVLPILDEESASSINLATQVNGTGPFKVTEFTAGDVMRLQRFDNYWNKDVPHLDGIDIRAIPDDSTLIAAMRTGEVQMAIFRPDFVRQLQMLKNVNMTHGDFTSGIEILLNCSAKGLDDVRVRRALALSIDFDQLMRTVIPGGYAGPSWHAPSGDKVFGYQGDGSNIPYHKRDLEKAKQLLAEAGYADGVDLEIAFVNVPSLASYGRASEIVIQHAAEAGIRIKAVPVDYAAATALQTQGSYVMYTGTGTMIVDVDPDSYYVASHSSSARSTCKDPNVDRLIEAQRSESDAEKRKAIVNELNEYIADQVFAITLFAMQNRFEVWSDKVKGYEPRPIVRRYSLQDAWLVQQ